MITYKIIQAPVHSLRNFNLNKIYFSTQRAVQYLKMTVEIPNLIEEKII